MVRLLEAALQDPDGTIRAHLEPFGTVDRYLTSVQDYLPYIKQPSVNEAAFEAPQVGQQAHAAVLQQLGSRTPQLLNGRQVYEAISTIRLLPLSVDSLDTMLGGGLKETTVTEIAGETCSGKTQLCHLAAATTAQRGERVHYFDTTNSFSAGRLQQLCDIKEPQALRAALDNISVVACHSIHALLTSLDEIAHQASLTAPSAWPKLVIVDSVSALLSPVIGASQHNQGHVLVAETARLLRHVADALQCCVIVTNHVVGVGGGFAAGREDAHGTSGAASNSTRAGAGGVNLSYKPALGEQWRGAAHVRLQLSRAGGDLVSATVLARTMRGPGMAWFSLGEQILSQG